MWERGGTNNQSERHGVLHREQKQSCVYHVHPCRCVHISYSLLMSSRWYRSLKWSFLMLSDGELPLTCAVDFMLMKRNLSISSR